jgi:hypothetical protein
LFFKLPPNWGKKTTPEGRIYYYNMLTDETTWSLDDINAGTGVVSYDPLKYEKIEY